MEAINENRLDRIETNARGIPRPKVVWVLISLQIFLAAGALLGGGAFMLSPDGSLIHMPFSHLKNSPFPNFLVPGMLLFVFLGIYPLLVAYSLWKRPTWQWPDIFNPFKPVYWSWAASLAAGVIVLIWITFEIIWVPFGLVHILYLGLGILLLILTLLPSVRRYYSAS